MALLDIPLQPKQIELRSMVEDVNGPVIIGVGGSKGSSKSHALRAIMLDRRIRYPGTSGIIFRRKWKQHLENTLNNGFFKTWPQLRKYMRWNDKVIHLPPPYDSRIVLGIAEHEADINDFQGQEYMDVFIDEATRCTQNEIIKLNETRRWTGTVGGRPIPDKLCKTLLGMNPGGPGHNYIRRLMYKREFIDKERPQDYAFLAAFAWDNVEWCRSALATFDCTIDDYYSWSDTDRFDFFIKYTQRGHELDNLPQRLRVGWLLGQWDEFAGQFYDIWEPRKHVRRCLPDRDWHPRWLGIDWGFQHPFCCHWMSRVGETTKIYREQWGNLKSARTQAQQIVDSMPESERKLIDAIYLSPDAFQQRDENESFAQRMGEVFRRYGMPEPQEADDDRKQGAQHMYDLMKDNQIEIDPSCVHLIEQIPMICTAEDDPEEIEKFDGDDAWDSARYGLKSRHRPGRKPRQEAAHEKVVQFAKDRDLIIEDMDPNTLHCLHRRALAIERKNTRKPGGLGRIWNPFRRRG